MVSLTLHLYCFYGYFANTISLLNNGSYATLKGGFLFCCTHMCAILIIKQIIALSIGTAKLLTITSIELQYISGYLINNNHTIIIFDGVGCPVRTFGNGHLAILCPCIDFRFISKRLFITMHLDIVHIKLCTGLTYLKRECTHLCLSTMVIVQNLCFAQFLSCCFICHSNLIIVFLIIDIINKCYPLTAGNVRYCGTNLARSIIEVHITLLVNCSANGQFATVNT